VLAVQGTSHFSPHLELYPSEPNPTMSSPSGSTANGDKIPEGSEKGVEVPESAPSPSWKRGRPKGSRNKSTLEALTAKAAAAASTSAAPQAAGASSGAGVP
jgi:hypothetical protein